MTVRKLRFERHCALRVDTVAALANAIGDLAARLLDADLRAEIFPPVAIGAATWEALVSGARLYGIRAARFEAVLRIGGSDARCIAAHAFGEASADANALSPLENRVLDRFVAELAPALEPLGGQAQIEPVDRSRPPRTYAQIRLCGPIDVSLGIGMLREPDLPAGPRLAIVALDGCPIDCSAQLGVATVDFFTLSGLNVGDVLRLDTKVGPSATLNLGTNPIAAGEGGIFGDRAAFLVHDVYPVQMG